MIHARLEKQYSTLQYSTIQKSTAQYSAVHGSTAAAFIVAIVNTEHCYLRLHSTCEVRE